MASDTDLAATRRPLKPGIFRYAMIDLASAEALRPIVPKLLSAVAEPLFVRTMPLQVLQVGPWLVEVAEAPEVERALSSFGPDAPWGCYLYAKVDIISLRQALRKFNLAQLADKTQVLFRYWDPRVLRVFLDAAAPVQRMRFLEWIDTVEWPDGSFLNKS